MRARSSARGRLDRDAHPVADDAAGVEQLVLPADQPRGQEPAPVEHAGQRVDGVLGGRCHLSLCRLDPGRLQRPPASAVLDLRGRGAPGLRPQRRPRDRPRRAGGRPVDARASVASSQRSRRSRIADSGRPGIGHDGRRGRPAGWPPPRAPRRTSGVRRRARPPRTAGRPRRPRARDAVPPVAVSVESASGRLGASVANTSTRPAETIHARSGSSSGAETLPLTRTSATGCARSLIAACPRPGGRMRRRPPAGPRGCRVRPPGRGRARRSRRSRGSSTAGARR